MSDIETKPVNTGRDLYLYWMSWIKRSKKNQPKEAWKKAEDMLLIADSDKQPYLSGFRLLYERLKSYLDQIRPTFDVVPSQAYFNDEFTSKASECDKKYLDYIWDEQSLQRIQSQKLDSALIRNCGYSLLGFDTKKWMPKLSYLKSEKVYTDPDCDGIKENAKAIAYEEDISIEEFVSKYKNIDVKSVLSRAGNILSLSEQAEMPSDVDAKMFKTVKIYHIFAKGDSAVRKSNSDNETPTSEEVGDLFEQEPRRYLQFAEGYEQPLVDGDWPYDIDNDEFPITELMFNCVSGSYYSYTDNDHMTRTDELCDSILKDVEENAYYGGKKKFAGSASANDLSRETIENFLNDPQRSYLPDMVDSSGNLKIQQIDTGKFEAGLMKTYELFNQIRKESSALGELLSNTAEDFKDVTALAVRVQDANSHQNVNRRLSGPFGYEESIKDDAIKILEIAHQYVPTLSIVQMSNVSPEGMMTEEMVKLPWPQVREAIANGGKLIQLGVDAIVGPELAQFWREGMPQMEFKLSTSVRVKKGSTRDMTQENKAAVMKQFYLEVLLPFYTATNRFDLAANYIKQMGQMAGIDHIDETVPSVDDARVVMQDNQENKDIQKQAQINQVQQQSMPQQGM